ncbi:MAG: beta-N-acetylhexosaminidase [Treponema sp.]|jgi:hexosaminidase|nr:beta-N-acetylhexosaminidase [Treponema sp.]
MSVDTFAIIPRPRDVIAGDGFFECEGIPTAESVEFAAEAAIFNEQMGGVFGGSITVPRIVCVKSVVETPAGNTAESYVLVIERDRVELRAPAAAGAYHGLQTLRQLFLSHRVEGVMAEAPPHFAVPCGEIRDAPRFGWRGFMLDCSRHFFEVASIKKILDALSLHHINVFHWHLTDDQGWRLPVPQYPRLIEIGSRRRDLHSQREEYCGGYYTEDEIREIVAFAAGRHITVVPEVDLPGHASAVLAAYPELGCTGGPYQVESRHGIFDDILCAGNDEIFTFVKAVFETLVRLFPGQYIHIGGDEAPKARWESCPRCKKRLAEYGLDDMKQMQACLTRRFAGMLADYGKTAVGWDEVLEGESPKVSPLPASLVVMSWRGVKGGLEATARGCRVVMSPNTGGCYFDYKHSADPAEPGAYRKIATTLESVYHTDPVVDGMSADQAQLVLGGQANLWSELIPADRHAEYMIFPRISALAEALWTPKALKNYASFTERLAVHRRRLDALGLLQYRGT